MLCRLGVQSDYGHSRYETSRPLFSLRSTVFWVLTPCSSDKSRRFERSYHLYLQSPTGKQSGKSLFTASFWWFLAWLILRLWRWRYVPTKRQTLSQRHDGTIQKIVLVIVSAERTSNPNMFGLYNQNILVSKANLRTVYCVMCLEDQMRQWNPGDGEWKTDYNIIMLSRRNSSNFIVPEVCDDGVLTQLSAL
jgi:hypothetical protein